MANSVNHPQLTLWLIHSLAIRLLLSNSNPLALGFEFVGEAKGRFTILSFNFSD